MIEKMIFLVVMMGPMNVTTATSGMTTVPSMTGPMMGEQCQQAALAINNLKNGLSAFCATKTDTMR